VVLSAPTFSPTAGTYSTAQSVTIGDATAGTTIYYTTNGTAPTTSSTKYTGAIAVSATETLQAIAVEAGNTNSPVATAGYTISAVNSSLPVPTFSPAAGTYTSSMSVTLTDTAADSILYYTTDGSAPTTSSTQYRGTLWLSSTQTLNVIAVKKGSPNSPAATATYTIARVLPTPSFSLAGGPAAYKAPQTVSINNSQSGASIYYTTDGTAPTTASTKYTGSITVSTTETIKAMAVETGFAHSAVASVLYTVQSAN
jgi:hypothetical protein